jgi:hypothetical protein
VFRNDPKWAVVETAYPEADMADAQQDPVQEVHWKATQDAIFLLSTVAARYIAHKHGRDGDSDLCKWLRQFFHSEVWEFVRRME